MLDAYPGNRFATWLEAELRKRDYYPSLAKAERVTGVPKSQISKYLRGEGYPSESTVTKLARSLNVSEEAIRAQVPRLMRESPADYLSDPSLMSVLAYGLEAARFFREQGIAPAEQNPFLERMAALLRVFERSRLTPAEIEDRLNSWLTHQESA